MNKYEFLSNKINYLFKKLFNLKNHPFYYDLNYVEKLNEEFDNYKKGKIKKKINQEQLNEKLDDIKIDNTSLMKDFDPILLKNLSVEMSKVNNLHKIFAIVNELYYMNIPSNTSNIEKLLKHNSKSNKINIFIIGAGPVGLFLACYLVNYYNHSFGLNNHPKVNVIVFDNRITKPGERKPYNRHRPFAFNSGFFSQIIPRIYGWDDKRDYSLFLNIYILEYVLFTKAYFEYSIPFVFDPMDWEKLKTYTDMNLTDVVFDCTGGHLKTPLFNNIDTKWIDQIKTEVKDLKINKENPSLKIIPSENLVKLDIDTQGNKFPKNYYYGSISIFKKKSNQLIFSNKVDLDITNKEDYELISKLSNKYYSYDNINKIVKSIKLSLLRNYLHGYIERFNKKENYIFKIEFFNTYIRHAIQVSEVMETKNNKCLFIGAGDSIFHSHFITGAGLNRTINFVAKCANFLLFLDLLD